MTVVRSCADFAAFAAVSAACVCTADAVLAMVSAAPRMPSADSASAVITPEIVDLALVCLRTGRKYVGEGLHLSEVTETVARLKVPLAASGGVELAGGGGKF